MFHKILAQLSPRQKQLLLTHGLPLALCVLFGAVIAIGLGQDANWDLRNYHYYNPWALLHHRMDVDFAPAQLQTFYNPLLDLLPYALMVIFKPIIAGAALGALQGANGWLVYELSRTVLAKIYKRRMISIVASIATVGSFFGAVSLCEIGSTMGDNISSIVVLLSLLVYVRNIAAAKRAVHPRATAAVAFALMGCAVGLKLTNVPYLAALLITEVVTNHTAILRMVKNIILYCIVAGGSLALFIAPWSYVLWKHYKNPFFPYFNNIFHSPYVINAPNTDTRFLPPNFLHAVFYPFYFVHKQHLVAEMNFRDIRFASVFLLAALLISYVAYNRFKKHKQTGIPAELIALIVFFVASYAVWEKNSSIYRYALVMEFISLVIITGIIGYLVQNKKKALIVSAAFCMLVGITTVPLNYGRIPWQPSEFGVRYPKDLFSRQSTVLITGHEPLGFMVPALPQNARAIRVDGNLRAMATPQLEKTIHAKVAASQKTHDAFYALGTQADLAVNNPVILTYGFKNQFCQPVPTNFSQPVHAARDYYQICTLVRTDQ